ncbi:MAG: L,D-transpeptidase [Myxococcales bacterium]|nr:L,D-transpeptidase [Myxococcales bacterium]
MQRFSPIRAKVSLSAIAATATALSALSGCSRVDEWWSAVHGTAHANTSGPDAFAENIDDDASAGPATSAPRNHHGPDRHERDSGTVDASAAPDSGVVDASGPYTGPTMTATWVWVPIFERMDWNGPKVGYFRAGASLRLRSATSLGNGAGCPRGWYEVEGGGYVCLNRMTTLDARELEGRRPTQPDLAQAMPYPYMTTYRPAVMYRWLPSEADMREVEPERFGVVRDAGAAVVAAPTAGALLTTGVPDGGAAVQVGTASAPTQPNGTAVVATRAQAEDAGVRIEDLQGESGTPLLRRMLSGMYISIDREMASAGRRFLRTQNGGYIERGAASAVRNAPTFQGVTLDEQHPLPMAFMVAFEGYTYDLSPDGQRPVRRERVPRLTTYHLTSDPPVSIGRENYLKTREGFYVRERNVRVVRTSAAPADVGATEKWIEVNLDRQMLIAYEGSRPVYVTLVSTGRRNRDDEQRNYETVQGAFRIYAKHLTTTMDGNSAGDGPYSIEDVPWVMYFEGSFALHGAFWHNLFGYMRSHGCVNMAPADARWVFQWSDPQLPAGWHGVNASTVGRPGTRVYVHYERQALGERGGPRVVPGH